MATKKKKAARRPKPKAKPKAKPKPSPKRTARKKSAAAPKPKPASAAVTVDTPIESSNALLFALLAIGLMILAWFALSAVKGTPAAPAAPAAAAAPAPASTPEAHTIASPAPKAEAPKAGAAAHREAAGADEPALTFDRSLGQALTLRCWRSEGGQAQLDVFDAKNHPVRNIKSESGPAGWLDLSWDGKNAKGKAVAMGAYYLRASQKAEQVVHDVQVK